MRRLAGLMLVIGLLALAAHQEMPRGFRAALAASPGVALIAEVKKASPSAGVIREDFDPSDIARQYAEGGARCLSVLTDLPHFQGKLDYLRRVRQAVGLPVLRKDFILDEIQVAEARAWGADCILLIVAALTPEELHSLMQSARGLGMDVLVEVHDRDEMGVALDAGADLVGINNRNLRTFDVDLGTTEALASFAPAEALLVSESGIQSRQDVERLKACGVKAVLVGESLMRSQDIAEATRRLSDV